MDSFPSAFPPPKKYTYLLALGGVDFRAGATIFLTLTFLMLEDFLDTGPFFEGFAGADFRTFDPFVFDSGMVSILMDEEMRIQRYPKISVATMNGSHSAC
jgi:hypothetical protein